MSATDTLVDAGSLTKRYLSALWLRGLLKLGVVVLFLSIGFTGFRFVGVLFNPETVDSPADLWAYAWLFAGGIGVYAAFRYLAAALEFVFVTSLRTRELALRRSLHDHLGAGVWLLMFRAGIVGVSLAVVGVATALLVGTDMAAFAAATTRQELAVAAVALLAWGGWLTVDTLTTGFVVPIMQHTNCGPLSGWRRFGTAMSTNWRAVVAFLLVAWVVGFGLWMALFGVSFVMIILGIAAVALIGSVLTAVHSAFEPVVFVLLLVVVVGYQYLLALIEAPVRSYVRYYALVVLGAAEPGLDLIADHRAAIAETTETASSADAVESSTGTVESSTETGERSVDTSEISNETPGESTDKTPDESTET